MRDFFARSFSSLQGSSDNLSSRIRANFREAFRPVRWKASSANGAPLHLLNFAASPRAGRAQGVSFLTHAGLITVLAILALHPKSPVKRLAGDTMPTFPTLKFPPDLLTRNSPHPDPGAGSGGGHVQIPATAGDLARTSAIQIVRPSLPPEQESHMPVPPTILDPNATAALTPVDKLGLPWMKIETHSPGPGPSNTIGSGPGPTMGEGPTGGPGGVGERGNRFNGATSQPTCLYCPNPGYTDEARESKLQGMMTLSVLVGPDGRATDIRVARGLGMGLDERAREAVRTWRFAPGRDPARHPVATWITLEVTFRLF
jgi:periplasmic protein TonB